MHRYSRLIVVVLILLSSMAMFPQQHLFAGTVGWQRFAQAYEDTVNITLAQYFTDGGNLEVHATSTSSGGATLTVYRESDNTVIGTLTANNTNNDYRGVFAVASDPGTIMVRSSLNGEDTATVTMGTGAPQTLPTTGTTPATNYTVPLLLMGGLVALGIGTLALMLRRSRGQQI